MEKILITGANGLIGKKLSTLLSHDGYAVTHLVRQVDPHNPVNQVVWNPEKGALNEAVFESMDHVIHLAGSNISGGRWNAQRKKEIHSSRIETAHLLFERSGNANLKTFVSASGISIYGTVTSSQIFNETDPSATDFLARVTVDWEQAADRFKERGVRVVKLRTAVVLAENGGALERIAKPIRSGFGTILGSGNQYFPWIHIDDLCGIYRKALKDSKMQGSYNAVAPAHCTNRELTLGAAAILGKKIWLPPAPAIAIKLAFGEMANLVLKGSRISSDKIQQAGYHFQYPTLDEALHQCLKK